MQQKTLFPGLYLRKCKYRQSSGGHSAIRLGKIVYHFQYFPDKIFHIIKRAMGRFSLRLWNTGKSNYIYSQNELDKKVFNHFFERLNEIYLYQKKELDNLEKLENDVKILESILKGDGRVYLKKELATFQII